jgi:hypothetical protein
MQVRSERGFEVPVIHALPGAGHADFPGRAGAALSPAPV